MTKKYIKEAQEFFKFKINIEFFLEDLLPLTAHNEWNQNVKELFNNGLDIYLSHNSGRDRSLWLGQFDNILEYCSKYGTDKKFWLTGFDTAFMMMLIATGGQVGWTYHYDNDRKQFLDDLSDIIINKLDNVWRSINNTTILDLPIVVADVPICTISNIYLIDWGEVNTKGAVEIGDKRAFGIIRDLQ